MSDSAQEKTEKPTPKRKQDARKKGQVPRSRELNTAAVVAAGVMALSSSSQRLATMFTDLMRNSLQIEPGVLADPSRLAPVLGSRLFDALMAVAPILGATLVAAIAAPALIGGFNFSVEALKPDFSRMNPISGLGRMFSARALVELGKSLLKFGMIAAIGAFYVWGRRAEFGALSGRDIYGSIRFMADITMGMLTWMTGALVAIALIDAPYQLWTYMKQLRMSRQDIRDEMKQSEGEPEVKQRIRRLQHEMARGRMAETVPTADVVVTNPTHYAVALKYSPGKHRAPIVVAKGADELAATIREIAREHKVPLVSAPPLARALYRGVNLEREIPPQLYAAVAKVLTYVYQLKRWRGGTPMPELAELGEIENGHPDVPPGTQQ